MSGYSRRRLLSVGGAVTVGAVAGCLDDTESTGDAADDGPVLETITLENLNSRSHTLDIIIQWDDEIEYWEEYDLSAISDSENSTRRLDGGWPTDPGEFRLTVRLDGSTRERFSSSQLPDRNCLDLVFLISREGELSILSEVSGGACADEAADGDDADDALDDIDDE